MKIFIYGMQSSGASLIARFLGQIPDSVVIADLWNAYEAPHMYTTNAKDIILKCVITTKFSLQGHLKKFKPDKTILVLRHPYYNYISLERKDWANKSGHMGPKFKLLESIFCKKFKFDLVILYEDFILRPHQTLKKMQKIGLKVEKDFFKFKRSKEDMLKFDLQHSRWCEMYYQKQWGFGCAYIGKRRMLNPLLLFKNIGSKEKIKVKKLCPSVCKYYENNFRWYMYLVAILRIIALYPFYLMKCLFKKIF